LRHPESYQQQKVVVLGLAKSGQAVARLFHQFKANVIANDRKHEDECPEATALRKLGINVICGHHPTDLIDQATALVVKNPGIPYSAAPVQRAKELGIEVVTEVEVAYHLLRSRTIGITGSNGKTTTTAWIKDCFDHAGMQAQTAGNIGVPLSVTVAEGHAPDWLVVELSSFQLKGTVDFRTNIACILNVSETHLDYHGTIDDYIDSKLNMARNLLADDLLVLNWDDAVCRQAAVETLAHQLPFSTKEKLTYGVCLQIDHHGVEWIVYVTEAGKTKRIIETKRLGLPGRHNVENGLAVCAVALAAGLQVKAIRRSLEQFRGVEHRLELVRELNGVFYYNNSKATNAAATAVALAAFSQPVILIAGGMDRGTSLTGFIDQDHQHHVKAVITLGETKHQLAEAAVSADVKIVHIVEATDPSQAIEEAVQMATSVAQLGDVVLLSPACASWDMFSSFEERGSMFKQSVHNLV